MNDFKLGCLPESERKELPLSSLCQNSHPVIKSACCSEIMDSNIIGESFYEKIPQV